MIFSEQKWNGGKELRQFVKTSATVSFSTFQTPLRNAFEMFIRPLLGESMTNELIEIYRFGPDPKTIHLNEASATTNEVRDNRLLQMCQMAVANLALWYDFNAISVRITDAGFQRQESENGTLKPAYKYQEDQLKQSYKERGFNALDSVLDFLFANIDSYPEFKESSTYHTRISSIVRNTADVNEVYFINNSRLIFLRLQTHIRFVEENNLVAGIGERLYNHIIDSLKEGVSNPALERLLPVCRQYIVSLAVRRLMLDAGSITDRGLYFTQLQSGKEGNMTAEPADANRVAIQIQQLLDDSAKYMTRIQRIIRQDFSDMYSGDPRTHHRNNSGGTIFWG